MGGAVQGVEAEDGAPFGEEVHLGEDAFARFVLAGLSPLPQPGA